MCTFLSPKSRFRDSGYYLNFLLGVLKAGKEQLSMVNKNTLPTSRGILKSPNLEFSINIIKLKIFEVKSIITCSPYIKMQQRILDSQGFVPDGVL